MELHVVRLQDPDAEGHDGPLGSEHHELSRLGVLGDHLNGVVTLQLVLHVSHVLVQEQVLASSQRDGGSDITNYLIQNGFGHSPYKPQLPESSPLGLQ